MDYTDDTSRIREFRERHPAVAVSYGGDGEILNIWREADQAGKVICPVRNYGRCEKHADPFSGVDLDLVTFCRPVVCDCLQRDGLSFKYSAISEIQVKSADVTAALRMDVYVDDRRFLQNVIADGIICSTAFGATGYFSSIARTLFVSGIGFAFIAPTLGVNNLVLPAGSKIEVRLTRPASVTVAADKATYSANVSRDQRMLFFLDPRKNVGFVGLDAFHCPECRARRHGTTVVNQYFK